MCGGCSTYVEKSIDSGTQWVVFEPNDLELWERVKRNIVAIPDPRLADGALFGADAGGGLLRQVRRGAHDRGRRDDGQLIVEIGIAPVNPPSSSSSASPVDARR